MASLDKIIPLKNPVQEYAWGSKTALQSLLRDKSYAGKPVAEIWIGAHPIACSLVLEESQWIPLDKIINKKPEVVLGTSIARRFDGKLPFLFKIIAVESPLSVQVHPNLEQAKDGFSRENSQGISIDSPKRNFKDSNHKPELICPLTPFEALSGFRNATEVEALMDRLFTSPESEKIIKLKNLVLQRPVEDNFRKLFTMSRTDQVELVKAVMRAAEIHENENPAFSWLLKIGVDYPEDICVLAPIFLNYIKLDPGQAMYIESGEVHSYLQGEAVELMANSDNVVRGGLTKKHVNVEDFLGIVKFSSGPPLILNAEKKGVSEFLYPPLCDEFQLSVIRVQGELKYSGQRHRGVEIVVCMEGEARLKDLENECLNLGKGDSVIIPAAVKGYTIAGNSIVYKASVPNKKSY